MRERSLTIDLKSSPPDDHTLYLKLLLSIKKRDAMAEAVAWLRHLMSHDIHCPPGLLGVLWECMLAADNLVSDDLTTTLELIS